jgi:hypothetical protein
VVFYRLLIKPLPDLDQLSRPGRHPPHLVAFDHIVRSAGKIVASDGRPQRDRVTIESEVPLRRMKGRDDLAPATAAAQVNHDAVLDADVNDASLEHLRDEVDELVLDAIRAAQS